MSLLKDLLDHHCSSDFNLEQVVKLSTRGPYDLLENNSNILLVTIGDSWTYGARLSEEFPADPDRGRIEHCYGYQLAQYLKADFLKFLGEFCVQKKYISHLVMDPDAFNPDSEITIDSENKK